MCSNITATNATVAKTNSTMSLNATVLNITALNDVTETNIPDQNIQVNATRILREQPSYKSNYQAKKDLYCRKECHIKNIITKASGNPYDPIDNLPSDYYLSVLENYKKKYVYNSQSA